MFELRSRFRFVGTAVLFAALLVVGCGESSGRVGDSALSDAPIRSEVSAADGAGGESSGTDAQGHDGLAKDASVAKDATIAKDASGGGKILFSENFEDTSFSGRGWYDSPKATLSTVEHHEGQRSFVCLYKKGAKGCAGGTPGRHAFTPTESVYVAYDVKYSKNFVGSMVAYHPHEFNVVTTADTKWIGPAFTYLTLYVEQVGGVPQLALQDSKNVDLKCLLLNNGSFLGFNGDFKTYSFSEKRSVCACNGIVGDLDKKDCFKFGGGYYSARVWAAKSKLFGDQPGPQYKNDWHRVEALFKMNRIVGGKGVPDGLIRYWFDGKLVINYSKVLMRTGDHPNIKFNQFMFGNYIGVGSPVDQTMWVDRLVVATDRL